MVYKMNDLQDKEETEKKLHQDIQQLNEQLDNKNAVRSSEQSTEADKARKQEGSCFPYQPLSFRVCFLHAHSLTASDDKADVASQYQHDLKHKVGGMFVLM